MSGRRLDAAAPAAWWRWLLAPPPMGGGPTGAAPPNNLVLAILGLLCCWPIGIPPSSSPRRSTAKWASGDHAGAVDASAKAKKFAIIAPRARHRRHGPLHHLDGGRRRQHQQHVDGHVTQFHATSAPRTPPWVGAPIISARGVPRGRGRLCVVHPRGQSGDSRAVADVPVAAADRYVLSWVRHPARHARAHRGDLPLALHRQPFAVITYAVLAVAFARWVMRLVEGRAAPPHRAGLEPLRPLLGHHGLLGAACNVPGFRFLGPGTQTAPDRSRSGPQVWVCRRARCVPPPTELAADHRYRCVAVRGVFRRSR